MAGLVREVRRIEPPVKWMRETSFDRQLADVRRVALRDVPVAVVEPDHAQAVVDRLDRRRGDDAVDSRGRTAADEDRERVAGVIVLWHRRNLATSTSSMRSAPNKSSDREVAAKGECV